MGASVKADVIYTTSHIDKVYTDHQLIYELQSVTVGMSAHRGGKAVASGELITQSLTHTPHSH